MRKNINHNSMCTLSNGVGVVLANGEMKNKF